MTTQTLITAQRRALPAEIADSVRAYVDESKADNTKDAYSKAWASFVEFCELHSYDTREAGAVVHYLTAFADGKLTRIDPATGETIGRPRAKLATLELHKSAISFMHGGRSGAANPALSPEVRTLMQGIKRTRAKAGETKDKARPILLNELRAMVKAAPPTLAGLRDRAILLVGWFAALRRSEIAALDVRSLIFRPDALIVTLGQTKTDQAGEGYAIPLPVLKDKSIDPTHALRAWLAAAGIGSGRVSETPLFVRVDRWGHAGRARINEKHIDTVVKRVARLAGMTDTPSDYRRISGHSLRAGFTTQAGIKGWPNFRIKRITRHKSDAVLEGYIREGGGEVMQMIRAMVGEGE
jgi:integrase